MFVALYVMSRLNSGGKSDASVEDAQEAAQPLVVIDERYSFCCYMHISATHIFKTPNIDNCFIGLSVYCYAGLLLSSTVSSFYTNTEYTMYIIV